jgi:hypothetical protein
MFGKILAFPFRLANVPMRAAEKLVASACGEKDIPEDMRFASAPLEKVAEAIEEATEK